MSKKTTKKYKRVLIKLSGEMLMGEAGFGIDQTACSNVARALHNLQQSGLEVSVVIGGGNIFRGIRLSHEGMPRSPADQMGMLATMINGIALKQALTQFGDVVKVMSAIECPAIVTTYNWAQTMKEMERGTILIFVGGTGNPYFTTDTAAAMRAAEIDADILLKGTKVDGIYDRDPLKFSDAVKYDKITYAQVLAEKLEVMDSTAIALCQQNAIPIVVFDMQWLFEENPLSLILPPNTQGTLVDMTA